jgi:hypothetical protein
LLIHRTMIREELERKRALPQTTRRPMTTIRFFIGHGLIAMGTRLAPTGPRNTDSRTTHGRVAVAR